MVDVTEENGLTENNTAKVHMLLHQDKRSMENGKTEKE